MTTRPAPTLKTTLLIVLLLGASAAPHAQEPPPPTSGPGTVYYRCGPKGQDLRSTPCPADLPGRAVALPQDRVDPDQAQAARQRVQDEARHAEALRRQREHIESGQKPGAAGIRDQTGPRSSAQLPKPSDPRKPKPKDPKAPPPKKPKVPKEPKPPKPKTEKAQKSPKPANPRKKAASSPTPPSQR